MEHEIVEVVADKGYQDPKDMANALAAGIIPNVIQRDGDDVAEVEFEYVEATVTDDMLNSKSQRISKLALRLAKYRLPMQASLTLPKLVFVNPTNVRYQVI